MFYHNGGCPCKGHRPHIFDTKWRSWKARSTLALDHEKREKDGLAERFNRHRKKECCCQIRVNMVGPWTHWQLEAKESHGGKKAADYIIQGDEGSRLLG